MIDVKQTELRLEFKGVEQFHEQEKQLRTVGETRWAFWGEEDG